MLQTNFIYKVNYLIANNINAIHVFYGENLDETGDLGELFKREPKNEKFQDSFSGNYIFNDEEIQYITENNVSVTFSSQQIHFDDTIGTIKLKIVQEFSNNFSLEEIHLFCLKEETFNPANIYQILTQNKKLPLTRVRLDQFLSNIIRDEQGDPVKFEIPEKEEYDYDDILSLNISNKKLWVSKGLGQKFFLLTNEYTYVCNPYDVNAYDDFIEKVSRKSLTTLNSHLLLNSGLIVENNIYLCLAKDVLTYMREKGLSELTAIKVYYPFLYKNNIENVEQLEEKKYELLEKNKPLLELASFDSVNLFYDMYQSRKKELVYQNNGIKFIKVVLHSELNVKVPLDIIFKVLHATEKTPLIKYNPSSRQENIYRLYADKISKDGRKIPFLAKPTILKLMKTIGKTKSVSVYIEDIDTKNNIICEFEENGDIIISCEFEKIMNVGDVTTIFIHAVNPVIEEVKIFFEENAYTVPTFKTLFEETVDVKQITYQSIV